VADVQRLALLRVLGRTIAVRDTTIHYERAGVAPELLFIHGMCGDASVWSGQVERLAGRVTCFTYDRRGHTRSALGTEPESVETHAADAAALIEALGLRRTVVVGSSGGARIAVELARTRGDLIAGAVFSEPPIFSLEPAAGQAFMAEIAAVVRPAAEAGGPEPRSMPSSPWYARGCGRSWTSLPRISTGPTDRCCWPSSPTGRAGTGSQRMPVAEPAGDAGCPER
jgi:pimeloyl-ACP methyl ester carboxylesterase